jgi:hypothetical protein
MKVKLLIEKEYEANKLHVEAGVRYWEDTTVNGEEDHKKLIPCVSGEVWKPIIDIDTGQITNWISGFTADVHYKVCDQGRYTLFDEDGIQITSIDGYVPTCMCPKECGYGDYIIMEIDKDGFIKDWKFDPEPFNSEV